MRRRVELSRDARDPACPRSAGGVALAGADAPQADRMPDRAAKTALFDEFARAAKALASGRRIELLDVLAHRRQLAE